MQKSNFVLRVLAYFGKAMIMFPIQALFYGLFGATVKQEYLYFFISLLVGIAFFAVSVVLYNKTKMTSTAIKVCSYPLALIICGVLWLLLGEVSIIYKIIMSLSVIAMVTVSVTNFEYIYYSIYTKKTLFTNLLIYPFVMLPCAIFGNWIRIDYNYFLSVVMLIIAVLPYGIIVNRMNIEKATESRHYPLEALPKDIYKFNMKLLGVISIFLMLIICLAVGLDVATERVAGYVASQIKVNDTVIQDTTSSEEQQVMRDDDIYDEIDKSYEGNKVLGTIMNVTITIFFVGFFLFGLFMLIQMLPAELRYRLSRRFKRKNKSIHSDEKKEYVDYKESIVSEEKVEHYEKKSDKVKFKKLYKKYLAMPNTQQKFHYGYKLSVKGLKICGIDVQKADTPNEISAKNKMLGKEEYSQLTNNYNRLTYSNGEFSNENISELDSALKNISDIIVKIR